MSNVSAYMGEHGFWICACEPVFFSVCMWASACDKSAYVCLCMYIYMRVCIYMCLYVFLDVYVYVYVCASVCVYMCK